MYTFVKNKIKMDGDSNNLMNENTNHEEHTANASIWYLCAFLLYTFINMVCIITIIAN